MGTGRVRRLILAFLALAVTSAAATERFRLGARFGGGDIMTEWIELDRTKAAVQVDAVGGSRMWDTRFELARPLEARKIVGGMYPFFGGDTIVAVFEGERVGETVRLARTAPGEARQDSSVAWTADGIHLPRGLLGYELVLRETRARSRKAMEFTWFDPQFRTQRGSVEFVDAHHARFRFEDGMVDEFVVDDKARITGGELGVGGTVYRGDWLPDAKRPRTPCR